MSEWEIVKLNEVLKHKKASIKIDEDTEYKLCRVQVHRRGVVLRAKQFGHQIKTKKQQVCQTGDLIVAEMDAKFGGYGFIPSELNGAIVSSHYYLYELDKNKISQDYFQTLISTDYIQNQIEAKGSTNYSSIRAKEFLEYEIPLPSLELQNEISKRFLTYSDFKTKLNDENSIQQTYLTKLRQALLQEAIEGKLTADWRTKNPVIIGNPDHDANALLEKIKTEKQRLISEGKIKKEKPLLPIKPDEIPFNLPQGWVWVRFCDVCSKITDGEHITPPRISNGKMLLSAKNIRDGYIDYNNVDFISEEDYLKSIKRCKPELNDILIVSVGATIGRSSILNDTNDFAIVRSVALIKPIIVLSKFTKNLLDAPIIQKDITQRSWGSAQPCLYLNKIKEMLIPLPPLAEQQAIVERVERLLNQVNALEQQTKQRKTHAEQLMQAVLKEAFTG